MERLSGWRRTIERGGWLAAGERVGKRVSTALMTGVECVNDLSTRLTCWVDAVGSSAGAAAAVSARRVTGTWPVLHTAVVPDTYISSSCDAPCWPAKRRNELGELLLVSLAAVEYEEVVEG